MDRRQLLTIAALLLGGSVAKSAVRAALAAPGVAPTPAAQPVSDTVRAQIAVLTELIIPETDTPGAIAAGVPNFVERTITQWYTEAERRSFLGGLDALDAWCRERFGDAFLECPAARQIAALSWAERSAAALKAGEPARVGEGHLDEHTPFFAQLKQLTVLGYYTSEVGATRELRYDPVPDGYEGDREFGTSDRQWSV